MTGKLSFSRVADRYCRRDEGGRTRPLRCLFVITSMPVGGAETLLVSLMRRFDASRIIPEVACVKERGPLGDSIAGEFTIHSNLIGGKYDIGIVGRLVNLIHQREIDALITVGAGDKMFWGRLAARAAGVPVVASALHSTGWPDGVGKLNRLLTRFTDKFIAVADSHGEFLVHFEGFPKDKVAVIRNGVDCQRFQPDRHAKQALANQLGIPENAKLVGIVAALRSEKNHGMLVRAAAKLRGQDPSVHWIIVGDGPERTDLTYLAKSLHVEERVHFMGTRHDTPQILAGLDVFTLCSLNEASPVSILEALACQVPVVATNVGSVRESVVPMQTGLLVESEDLDAYVAALGQLLADEGLRQKLGHQGRQLVLETGSLASMVRGYEDLIIDCYDAKLGKVTVNDESQAVELQSVGKSIPARPTFPMSTASPDQTV